MKYVGRLWNDSEIEIVEVDGKLFALYGWNGEEYCNCWEVADDSGLEAISKEIEYTLKPIYEEFENEYFEIIDFEIRKNS